MQSSLKSTFNDRLQSRLEETGIKQTELCNKTGIGKSAMSQYLHGAFVPKKKRLRVIAEALDVSEEWLMGYDVPKYRTASVIGGQKTDVDTEEYFVIEAHDNAMEPMHIPEGAKVILKKLSNFYNGYCINEICQLLEGKIVGLTINKNETLLRFLHKTENQLIITAANPKYLPQVFDITELECGNIEILGVAERVEIRC